MALYFWQDGAARLLVFACLYAAGEWMRGHALTGFPWNLPAYGWGASLEILQNASLVGAYGLSFLTILLGASLADLHRRRYGAFAADGDAVCSRFPVGLWRLAASGAKSDARCCKCTVAAGAARCAAALENPRSIFARNWQRLLDLSARPGAPTHIIWPEAAPPHLLFDRSASTLDDDRDPDRARTACCSPVPNMLCVAPARSWRFNSLYIFGPGGALRGLYDKFHLVPFGEYIPFDAFLNQLGIEKLTGGRGSFDTGDGVHVYQVPGAPPVTPLICYEIIFPAAVTDHQQRPGWFVNVTDDSWFGPWAGPYQHILIARVRAIEEAIPVARAANTGISAVIDPVGRVTAQLGLGKMGVVDAQLAQGIEAASLCAFR